MLNIIFVSLLSILASTGRAEKISYGFYNPEVVRGIVYEGKSTDSRWKYNHCASLAYFDGKFHAVWNANESGDEGKPMQVILWASSSDFITWSDPKPITRSAPEGRLEAVEWHPNLIVHKDELWCFWYNQAGIETKRGTVMSKLKKGQNEWVHRWLFVQPPFLTQDMERTRMEIPRGGGFVAQNVSVFKSGRVVVPMILHGPSMPLDDPNETARTTWNMAIYSDDDGESWSGSNLVSAPSMFSGQWEPTVYEQKDGDLRMFMKCRDGWPKSTETVLTVTGKGADKGQPMIFDTDAQFSSVEGTRPRIHVLESGGRYIMLRQDIFTPEARRVETRVNLTLHFSRTGRDDFIAGPPISEDDTGINVGEYTATYPAAVAVNNTLYAVWTELMPGVGNKSPRNIISAAVPLPEENRKHIFSRNKAVVHLERYRDPQGVLTYWMRRTNPWYKASSPARDSDGNYLIFERHASAGVETEPVNLDEGDKLSVSMTVKVEELQRLGNAVLCSFGDILPIRIGIPSNRPETLYVYSANGWEPAGSVPMNQWTSLNLIFGKEEFSVSINDRPRTSFPTPLRRTNPRLYLGDGYEPEFLESNLGSRFKVDMETFRTEVFR
jgi:hypothetical protein